MRYEALGEVTKKHASDALAQKVAAAGNGKTPTRSRVTFGTLVNEWQVTVLPMYKQSTQKNHRHIVKKHLSPRFGDKPLSDVTRQEIQAYVAHLTQEGYAPKSIDHIHDALSAVLRTGVKWGNLPGESCGVDLPTLKCVRPKWVLTTTQAGALLEALPLLARTMAGVALLIGPTRRAVRAPLEKSGSNRWSPDRSGGGLRRCVWDAEHGGWGPSRSAVGHDSGVARGVEATRQKDGARGARLFDLVGETHFAEQRFASLDFSGVRTAQLPKATWLTFRRTYSSWAHDKGVPAKVVAGLMGHAKVDTTLNVYTQVIEDSVQAVAQRVGDELFPIVHKPEKGAELTH